jgi:hypothetical protein
MSGHDWSEILSEETVCWSSKSYDQLMRELREPRAYEVRRGEATFQVEVEILDKSDRFVQVSVAVDDGVLPRAMFPVSRNFRVRRPCAIQGTAR